MTCSSTPGIDARFVESLGRRAGQNCYAEKQEIPRLGCDGSFEHGPAATQVNGQHLNAELARAATAFPNRIRDVV